jgi:hypothetical protein
VAEKRITQGLESLYSQVSRPARTGEVTAETTKTATVETIDNDILSLLLSGPVGQR